MRPARLIVYQTPRNPSERERKLLALLAEGRTHREAAARLRLAHRSVTNALGQMRNRYAAPTNEALIVLAMRLQWITVVIECEDSGV